MDERGILQVGVRVEQNNRMAKLLLRCIREHAEKWRDPDPAGQEDSWPGCVVMEGKGAHWHFDLRPATDRQGGYGPLENCISHAGRDYKVFVRRRACDGERVSHAVRRPNLGLGTRYRQVDILPCLEYKIVWLFKLKCH